MKKVILTANISSLDREDLENISGQAFTSFDDIVESLDTHVTNVNYYTVTDFMDMCNNEEMILNDFWVTDVFLEECE